MEQKHRRVGHCEGQTEACFDESGRYIVSCGSDGAVRIWDGFDDDSPISHDVSTSTYSVAVKGDKFYVTTDNNSVLAYSFPDGVLDGMISKFTDVVNHIHCSSDGKYLAMGGGDFLVKIAKLGTDVRKSFSGHQAPILSVAVDPMGQFVASSSCDGTVKIWNIESGECFKTFTLLPKCNDFSASKTLARLSWHPSNGNCLVVPVNKEVHVFERTSWKLKTVLKDNSLTEVVSITSFSHCGSYVAAATYDGKIVIWNFSTENVVVRNQHQDGRSICNLAWRPITPKDLLYTDNQGEIGIIENIESSKKGSFKDTNDKEDFSAIFANDDSFDDLDCNISRPIKKKVSRIEEDDDDSNAIDIGAIKATFEPKIFGSQEATKSNSQIKQVQPVKEIIHQKVPLNIQQKAFQPGSTPVHFQHRYMIWNNTGLVCCYNTEEENSIDVEFHDTKTHHAIHLTNSQNYTMAALSEDGLVLASSYETERPSKLLCVHFGTWDANREWMVDMEEEEQIETVTLGKSFVACVTNLFYLRLFSIGGLQLGIYSISGPVVCLAALDKTLLVVYHRSAGLEDSQDLALMTFAYNNGRFILKSSQPISLSPKSTLSWFGFTDEGTPCSVDSKGIVRLLINSLWLPVLNTKEKAKGKSDVYFVVGLSEITQLLRCILCKGSNYPPILPRPLVSVLLLKMPFCELTTDKAVLEEEFCRYSYTHGLLEKLLKDDFEVDTELAITKQKMIENLMKLFALSTRSEREYRALEVCRLMPSSTMVQGAIHYASQHHCIALAEKAGEVAHEKQREENGENVICSDEEFENEDNSPKALPFLNSRLSKDNEENLSVRPKPLNSIVLHRTSSNLARRASYSKDSMQDSNNTDENDEQVNEEEEEERDPEPQIQPSIVEEKKNPFNVLSQKKKSLGGIDSILENSLESKKLTKGVAIEPKGKKPRNSKGASENASKKRKAEKQLQENNAEPKKKTPKPSQNLSSNTTNKISSFLFKKD